MATREEEERMWADIAMEAAKKAKDEETKGAAPPNLDQLLALTIAAFGRGKTTIEDVVHGVRPEANKVFFQAMSQNAQERFSSRLGLFEKRYQPKTPAEAKKSLDLLWRYTERNGVAPKNIIINSPNDLQHSAVAMELTARLTSLNYKQEIAENPRFWWSEVERAYQSIDFHHLKPEEEAELRMVFERSFTQMRKLVKKDTDNQLEFPEDDKMLWRGLGDYYFSTKVSNVAGEPAHIKSQKEALNRRIKDFQADVLRPHGSDAEKRLLNTFVEDLDKGLATHWVDLEGDVGKIQYRAVQELQEFGGRYEGAGGGKDGDNAVKKAEAMELFDIIGESKARGSSFLLAPTAGMFGSASEGAMKGLFPGNEWLDVRSHMAELGELFKNGDDFEAFNFDDQGKLNTARGVLDGMLRSHGDKMSPEQRAIIERYKAQVESESSSLLNRERAPSRFYLPEDLQRGFEEDPIGTANSLFNAAITAYIDEPDSPLAKIYFEQLELAEYYLFSPQHSRMMLNKDIIFIKSQADLEAAIREGRSVAGRKGSAQEVADSQNRIYTAMEERARVKGVRGKQLEQEKHNFEREFKIRLKDAQFIQIWTNTAEANDEMFSRFLNGRMNEDSFWGIDGLYGGLVKRFRMELRRQYEKMMFNGHGDMNGHIDTIWDEAIRRTRDKMLGDKESIEIFKDYLNGEFFKDIPHDGVQSVLRTKIITDEMAAEEYATACDVINEFANMRMIMSGEKYNIDVRYRPTKDGVNFGQAELDTQFKEKQKIVKLIHRYGGWQKTWGGVMQGDPVERLEMREMVAQIRDTYSEVTEWGDERAREYWDKLQKFMNMKDSDIEEDKDRLYEFKRLYGEIQSLFEFSVHKQDIMPKFSTVEDAKDYFKYRMPFKRLQEECRFDSGMQIADMHGLFPYLGVSESGARRTAQMGILVRMLGGVDHAPAVELAKQNFLTFTQLNAGLGYFGTEKSTADTDHHRAEFLLKMSYITKYRPQANLLTLREGDSKTLRTWIKTHKDDIYNGLVEYAKYPDELKPSADGRELFGSYYEYLDTIHDDLFSQLAFRDQINYQNGYDGLVTNGRVDQKKIVDAYFASRNTRGTSGANSQAAEKEKKWYFTQMKQVVEYLGMPTVKESELKNLKHFGVGNLKFTRADAAIIELTNIRYGPLLMKMRWDDYPYELLQYPERAIPILMQSGRGNKIVGKKGKNDEFEPAHRLFDPQYATVKATYDNARTVFESGRKEYELAVRQGAPQSEIDAKKSAFENGNDAYITAGNELQGTIQKKIAEIRKDRSLESQYLTKATDHNEPQRAHDEQSGLWRRMWRDLGADAGLFSIWGNALSLDPHEAPKAIKQIHHTLVGVQGDDVAQINHLMVLTSRLGIQEVYKNFGSLLVGLPNSGPIKTVLPDSPVFAPDKISHEFEQGLALGSGKSSVQSPGASGFEYAAKKHLRISNWNGFLGGMHKREEFMNWINDRWSFTKYFINERTIDNLPESLDLHAPIGVWKSKAFPVTLAFFILIIVFAAQSTASGGKDKKSQE